MIKQPKPQNVIIFFIRRFNDIDHIVPIVYEMARTNKNRLIILSNNQYLDIKNDFRLKFLYSEWGVEIDYSYRFFASTFTQRLIASAICDRGYLNKGSIGGRLIKNTFGRLISHYISEDLLKNIFTPKTIAKVMEYNRISITIFDHAKPEQHITGKLLQATKLLGIQSISVPHGLNLVMDKFLTDRQVKEEIAYDYDHKLGQFDYVVAQFEFFKKRIVETGFEESKITILGSTRYCPEWRKVYLKIAPTSRDIEVFKHKDKLKVVFMEYSYNYRIQRKTSLESILNISKLDFVELIVKPHTRSNRLYADVLGEAGSIAYDIPSVLLCQEADVVIGTTSSILLEPLLLGKVLIYPKYFHENTMRFEQLGACWCVNSYDELQKAIESVWKDRDYKPYDNKNIEALETEVILGGKKDRNVLNDYVDFINSKITQ
jgi:hypothetical protein